jgi:HK97 family phage portal protein
MEPVTQSGKKVGERDAFKYSVFWAASTLISDAISGLRPEAFREDAGGAVTNLALPPWIKKPHAELRPSLVRKQIQLSALVRGNGYAQLIKTPNDTIVGMAPVHPDFVHCEWVPNMIGFQRRYRISGGPWLTNADIFHLQGPTMPGCATGMSIIAQAREAIGLGLTLEEFGARYFSQGSLAKTVIVVPGQTMKDDQAKQTVRNYERFHRGPGNWHRPALLNGPIGTDIRNISIPPEDAQFLQTREFQAMDVARWFRVPPHRVGIVSAQTSWGSGLAEANTAMVQDTYGPWITAWEELYTAYLPGGDGSGVQVRLNKSELLRGTFGEAAITWNALVMAGVATPNEARKALGLPRIDGGDTLKAGQSLTPGTPPGQNTNQGGAPAANPKGGTPNAA